MTGCAHASRPCGTESRPEVMSTRSVFTTDLALGLEELLEDERDGRARPLGDRDAARNLRRGRIASQPGPARTPAWRAASERSREQRAELRGRQVRPARQREVDRPGPRRRQREVGARGLCPPAALPVWGRVPQLPFPGDA